MKTNSSNCFRHQGGNSEYVLEQLGACFQDIKYNILLLLKSRDPPLFVLWRALALIISFCNLRVLLDAASVSAC
jgi:hypothetical protein